MGETCKKIKNYRLNRTQRSYKGLNPLASIVTTIVTVKNRHTFSVA